MAKEHPLLEALRLFDPANDDQWTSDGLPLVDLLTGMVGRPVSRREVNQLAPTFNRTSAATFFGFDAPSAPAAADAPAAPADQGGDAGDGAEPEEDPFADTPPSGAPAADPAKRAPAPTRGAPDKGDAPQAQPEPFPREADKVGFGLGTQDPKDLQGALDQIEQQLAVLLRERAALNAEIEALQNRSQVLSRLQERGRKANPRENQDHIQFYLAGTAKRREEQAARAKAIMDAGLSPAVLAAALNTKSKLDSSMARRTGFGNKRPVHPVRGA